MCKDGFIEDKVTGDCRQNARSTGDENNSIIGNYYGHQFHVKINIVKMFTYFLRCHNCLHYWRNYIADFNYYDHHWDSSCCDEEEG